MMALAIAVGIAAGLGTPAMMWMITFFKNLFFDGLASILSLLGSAYVIILPLLGGLIVGPLVYVFSPNVRHYGAPQVFSAITQRGGRIRPIVVFVQAVGAAVMIGSGASAGREGPIVQIGSTVDSKLGQ
jgi:chloride channel protein, CIC family